MLFILVVVELAPGIAQMTALNVAVGLEDVPRFKQNLLMRSSGLIFLRGGEGENSDLPGIRIDLREPLTQLLVPLCIVPKRTKCVNDDVHTLPVCETL